MLDLELQQLAIQLEKERAVKDEAREGKMDIDQISNGDSD